MALGPEEINDRQTSLLAQVKAGEITEDLTDTTDQLLALARHGLLEAWHDADGWHFSAATEEEPASPEEEKPEVEQES